MYTEADKCPPLFRHDVPRHTTRAKEQGSSSLLLCSLLHLCVDTADVARATDTHAELIKRRRDVNPARGTPDGILMSGVSSPLSDSPSDALMPSKCTLPTFSCVSRPRPLPRDSWLRRRAARVGWWAWDGFSTCWYTRGIHVKGTSSFGRVCALFVDSSFWCVGCGTYSS